MDILTYGQKELKDIINQLEEQLRTVLDPYQPIEKYIQPKHLPKSETKLDESEVHHHQKKQRVDKNKCRKCKLSTIPTILNLLQQKDCTDVNSCITMKSIRQQMAQQSNKKNEQQDSKIPYISFDYSHSIIICKRCRFKFHSECISFKGSSNEWLCDYCLNRIEELKHLNLWDYKNNKQLKQLSNLTSEQKKINLKILERIQKKKTIFTIFKLLPSPILKINQITEFLQRFPLYKSSTDNINYPVSEVLAANYPKVLTIQQKPKPQIIKFNMIEEILWIQTFYQIMIPNYKAPENVNQQYIEKHFYDIVINIIIEYFDEIISQDDIKFYNYCNQANAYTASYLFLMNYLITDCKIQTQDLIKKTWKECVLQIDQVINYNSDSKINFIDFSTLQFQDQIRILKILCEGLYDLDKMQELIKFKESSLSKVSQNNFFLNQQKNYKTFFQQNLSISINGGTYLGQDAFSQQYFYFTFYPSTIFVETKQGWGQYTISDLSELMNSLNQQGVNELDLFKNLELIQQIQLLDLSTQIQQKNIQQSKQQYILDIQEVIEKFICIEKSYSQFLQKKNLYWIDDHEKIIFFNLLKNQDDTQFILCALKQMLEGLIIPKSKNGVQVKPFKLFKYHFELINQLAIYVDNASSLSNIYISLLVLEFILNDKEQYLKQKEQMKIMIEKAKNKKIIKEAQKKNKKIEKQIREKEQEKESIKRNQNKKREIIKNQKEKEPSINKNQKKIFCFQCLKGFFNQEAKIECGKCKKIFHKECLKKNRRFCQQCFKNSSKRKQLKF
ncbi:unnamed protein product [Paramecium sonneborni]|uniref:WHIM2 domain-containing protein n=1 Tax=Paramecium sonneborni TaxID=65129 RepID=A0A8S1LR07_9CILI|nr:unnamed protein product [Paramecium sonneborni]